jgi:hypothetical protein
MSAIALHDQPIWVSMTELGPNRIDPLYYDPSLTVAEKCLRANGSLRWKRLGEVSSKITSFGAYELTNHIRFVHPSEDSIPFLTVTEITNPFVEIGLARHIDRQSHQILEKSRCSEGTLLLSMAGSIGRIGIVPQGATECNSNQDVAKIFVDTQQSDPYFLGAYFSTAIGTASCEREAAGAVQKHLYLHNIETLPVPDPPVSIRIAIGNKVRCAEKLRKKADINTLSAIQLLNECFGSIDLSQLTPNSDGSCDYFAGVVKSEQLGLFHGAQFYSPKRQRAVEAIKDTGIAVRIGDYGLRVRSKGKMNSGRLHIDPASVGATNGYWSSGKSDEGGDVALAAPGQVLFLRMRPYLNKTTINSTTEIVSASPEFLIYEVGGIDAYYVSLCLRQPWALAQVAEIATGDRPRVDGEFVDEVLVPWPTEKKRNAIGELYKSSFAFRQRADMLVYQSIDDVEKLIQGKLDERQYIAEGRILAEEFSIGNP